MVRRLLDPETARAAGHPGGKVREADAGEALPRRFPIRLVLLPATVALQLLLPSYPLTAARAFDATQLGTREARRGNTEAALGHYREALRSDPNSGETWHGTGAALAKAGRLPEAAEAYRRAVQIMPGSPVTHYNLGAVYGRLGDDAAALTEFGEAVRLDPFEPAYRSDLAVALARTGDRAAAIEAFRRVLARNPSYVPARRGLEALGERP
jgi:Flp pilus assembly protein TadD